MTTRPKVHVTNPTGDRRHTTVHVDGVDLSDHVVAVRWEHEAGDRPVVVLEVRPSAVAVIGELAGVEVVSADGTDFTAAGVLLPPGAP